MEQQHIIFETARLAKEKGFNLRCECFYNAGSGWKLQSDSLVRTGDDEFVEAPTQAQLQKWLREKGLFVSAETVEGKDRLKYSAIVKSTRTKEFLLDGFSMYTEYEDAIEDGLQEALKLIPSKKVFTIEDMHKAMLHIADIAAANAYIKGRDISYTYREINEYLRGL